MHNCKRFKLRADHQKYVRSFASVCFFIFICEYLYIFCSNMEACLREHFFVDDESTASWVLCELACLCEKPDEGLPICPDFWLVKHYCLTFLLSSFQSLCQSTTAASSSTTTPLPPPVTTTKTITSTTSSLSTSSMQV